MFDKIDPVIQRSLYIFMFVLISAILMVIMSYMYTEDAYKDRDSANRAMRIWKNKIEGSRQSNRIVDEYEAGYLNLVKNGVIGVENRLNWFETIQATAESRGMPSVKYSIASQIRHDDRNYKNEFSGINVYRSVMTLDIKMGHEGDLFTMLNNLESRAQGLFAVDKCNVEKFYNNTSAAKRNNMKANCELSWYTIRSAETNSRN